jgi:3'-phosphoadenosine 5'-phosphosulfate sulfotransferase (PAPS reductase)/FAD synthetase
VGRSRQGGYIKMNEAYLWEFLDVYDDITIVDSFVKANSVINSPLYETILCSISGGSDSDIILDLVHRVDKDKKVKYIWFNTGLEYQATKDHLDYLEKKYNIEIIRERAIKPIPLTCKEYGQPFLSKYVSQMLYRLQKYNFKFEDKPYEELIKEYPNCMSGVKWWCGKYDDILKSKEAKIGKFNVNYNKYLKEFLIANPPTFKISDKCCMYAKKGVGKQLEKKYNADLTIIGVRQAEGGIRASAYKNCYSINNDKIDTYRPIFWYKDGTKKEYEVKFSVIHSDCYTKYGFKRTGCCCCPYGRELEDELEITRIYEPKLYKAVCNVFKDSYEYTRKYREFVQLMKLKEDKTQIAGQMDISDFIEV